VGRLDIELALALDPGRSDISDAQFLAFTAHRFGVSGDPVNGEVPSDGLQPGVFQHLAKTGFLRL
jgi:hypothetical protein